MNLVAILEEKVITKYQVNTNELKEGDIIQFRHEVYIGTPIRAIILEATDDYIVVYTQKWFELKIYASEFKDRAVHKLDVRVLIGG